MKDLREPCLEKLHLKEQGQKALKYLRNPLFGCFSVIKKAKQIMCFYNVMNRILSKNTMTHIFRKSRPLSGVYCDFQHNVKCVTIVIPHTSMYMTDDNAQQLPRS